MQTTSSDRPLARPGLLPTARGIAALLVALVLIQSLMAGRSLFGTWDIEVHGWVGNATFVLGLAALWLAWAMQASRSVLAAAAALFVLLFAQVGLGYAGRESIDAAAWHIPNGVAIMGLAVYHFNVLPKRSSR